MKALIDPKAEQMKRRTKYGIYTLALMAVYMLALVGVMFLTSHRAETTASHCDKIQRLDDGLYCMERMQYEDDNIMVVKGVYGQDY